MIFDASSSVADSAKARITVCSADSCCSALFRAEMSRANQRSPTTASVASVTVLTLSEQGIGSLIIRGRTLASISSVVSAAALLALGNKRSEEHTSELQSPDHLVFRLLLEKK